MAETIVTQELAVRAVVPEVYSDNTMLYKVTSDGKLYNDLHCGNGVQMNSRGSPAIMYLDKVVQEYADPSDVPTPSSGCIVYYLTGDYDFFYLKFSDGTNKNRRIPLSLIAEE